MFVELKKHEMPLSLAPNPDPGVISCVIGEPTPTEQTACDEVLLSGIRHRSWKSTTQCQCWLCIRLAQR